MQFNSLLFLIFFIITAILYWILPHKARVPLLLVASYVFYLVAGPKLLVYLVACTLATYILGRLIQKNIEKGNKNIAKALMIIGVICDALVLGAIKYANFFINLFNKFAGASGIGIKNFNIIVPLGISFITFQTISYMIDIYRGDGHAEKNILKYATYVSFFPIVVQGPIEKARDIIPQFDEKKKLILPKLKEGIILVLFGLFLKLVIADRAAMPVNIVFAELSNYTGAEIIFALFMFVIQIYADFSGYSLIAIGTALILGINVKQNFRQPYMSTSISEFWRRWHISLNTWLKDYLYFPLGGSRCSKPRKYFNTMVTFTVSGFWHGANFGYVLWGVLNGVYVCVEGIFKDITGKGKKVKSKNDKKQVWPLVTIKRFFVLVFISASWLFFRAETSAASKIAIKKIIYELRPSIIVGKISEMLQSGLEGELLGTNALHYCILALSLIVLVFVDVWSHRHQEGLAHRIVRGNLIVRWLVLYALIFGVIIFGVYGFGYDAASFIYTRF